MSTNEYKCTNEMHSRCCFCGPPERIYLKNCLDNLPDHENTGKKMSSTDELDSGNIYVQ